MASSDSDFSNVEASAEVDDGEGIVNVGLPSGFERDLTYRQITLMLGKHHHLDMNERTLKRRLKEYGLKRRGAVNDELVELVQTASVATELCGMSCALDIKFMFLDDWLSRL